MSGTLVSVILLDDARLELWSTAAGEELTDAGRADQSVEYRKGFITENSPTRSVHAPALVELSDGAVMAVWYGGEREGSRDVAIYASWLSSAAGDWSPAEQIIERQRVANDLGVHIRKLGNAVLLAGNNREVWMFFVTASIGGWSTSHINMVHSTDGGKTWGSTRRLVASPFLNISTLVKGRPFFYQDGSIGLPVYHELAGKFSELLRLERDGTVRDKIRMTHGRHKIQPDIAIIDDRAMLSVMRDTSDDRKVTQMSSPDGGMTWSPLQQTVLPNPNSAVSISGDKTRLVLAFNDSGEHRNPLSLAVSSDQGKSWNKIVDIESGPLREDNNKDEFSYPYLVLTRSGTYHLVYTWKRSRIAHVRFNREWIKSKL